MKYNWLHRHRVVAAVILLHVAVASSAAELSYEVAGVSDPLLSNVLNHVQAFSLARQADVSKDDFDSLVSDAIENSEAALRPYGYYHPTITGRAVPKDDEQVAIRLEIEPGPPVVIGQVLIQLAGAGAESSALKAWRSSWPLTKGMTLDQTVWEERKQFALDLAERIGYLAAEYSDHRLELDLDTNSANLFLSLETGERFVFGKIDFGEHVLKPGIIEYIPRFKEGDPYSRQLLDHFRMDLRKTGYFTEVVVEETARAELSPPVVDITARLETTTRNTYQGSIGVGSDNGVRLQAQWGKHPLSGNGDRLDIGAGWQELDDEFSVRATYRLPRRNRTREFWTSDLILRDEGVDLDIRRSQNDDFIRVAKGSLDETHLRVGRLKVRNFKSGEQQAFETFFVQGLMSENELSPVITAAGLPLLVVDPGARSLLRISDKALSVGFDYDLLAVYGKAWETEGYRDRAWIFGSSKSFGSDRDFLQAYVSSRRSYLKGERWKFIVRAELGYTDAKVNSFEVDVDGQPLSLSVTTLPNFYRFRAGGSNSVRGYGFEELSTNHVGSNHIATASAEIEMKFLENWSAALFVDIGNAFNDWSKPELKKGVGLGIRWYSIAGPIRVDVAQALDLNDKPWRIHFNIGTPLL